MAFHKLKTDPVVFVESWEGRKKFEIRLNDRDYKEGDTLLLRETVHSGEDMSEHGAPLEYSGREINCQAGYILHGHSAGYGIDEGWCIISIDNKLNIRP